MTLNISDIQHFSVGDGDGIRTTVFFKGCNLCCPWCHNPETVSPRPQVLHFAQTGREQLCGFPMETDDVVKEILLDKAYYDASGGGATLSGGEAMLQIDGAAELAARLKSEGVSVTVDTAGNVPYSHFERMNPYADMYYFDLKAANAQDYAQLGGDFALIAENLGRLIADKMNVHARIPLIPGFNTASGYTDSMCDCLRSAGVLRVDLLPFHRLGSSKYEALGLSYAYCGAEPPDKETVSALARQYARYFEVRIEK